MPPMDCLTLPGILRCSFEAASLSHADREDVTRGRPGQDLRCMYFTSISPKSEQQCTKSRILQYFPHLSFQLEGCSIIISVQRVQGEGRGTRCYTRPGRRPRERRLAAPSDFFPMPNLPNLPWENLQSFALREHEHAPPQPI